MALAALAASQRWLRQVIAQPHFHAPKTEFCPSSREEVQVALSNKTIRNLNTVGQHQARLDHLVLVQWITRSDEPALAQFYDATNELLFGLVLHALRDTVIAEDVLSRAYADIKQEAARFDQSQ